MKQPGWQDAGAKMPGNPWEKGPKMQIVYPARTIDRISLDSHKFVGAIAAIGTERYSRACFEVFEDQFDVDHWALFQYRNNSMVNCMANDSRNYATAAKENISRFVGRFYGMDPTLQALKNRKMHSTCTMKVDANDIRDRQYRHCFELTHVQERLSFFSRMDGNLYQLSIFRGIGSHSFTAQDMTHFSSVAKIVLETALKHEMLRRKTALSMPHLDLEAIEELLDFLPGRLSHRERQVCSRVAAGMTIEGTALDLDIKRTSVVTYRQRAYEKLQISRQTELVALVNNLRVDHTRSASAT